jgi:putative membrane protein
MSKQNALILAAASALFATLLSAAGNPDEHFATAASQGGMAEVKLGQLASEKASNPKVRNFGQQMVTDHSKAGDELTSIVHKKGVTVPSDLTTKDQALLTRLSSLSGESFDKAYMSAMVSDHQEDISEFQKEANNGRDPDFKSFAGKTLPTLQEHLRMAQDAASSVGAK